MSRIWLLSPIALLAGCKPEAPTGPPERTLAEASEIALGHFRRQDGFSLAGRSEAIVASRPAVRLEVTYLYEGEERRGVVLVIASPLHFNVVYYTAPSEPTLFEPGAAVFAEVIESLELVPDSKELALEERGDKKILRVGELGLALAYPKSWTYTLDDLNRALVLSGPNTDRTHLAAISLSTIRRTLPADLVP